MTRALVLIAIFAHLSYYTLIIGGDHFEYRVYSYLPALWLVATAWLTNRSVSIGAMEAGRGILVSLLVVLLSWPIPWTYWTKARRLSTREETFNLVIPMADALPPGLGWYGKLFDSTQSWLIAGHAVGKRRREHQIFHQAQLAEYALPRVVGNIEPGDYPILATGSVGVPGWILRHVNIIDVWGLNDWVVARNPVLPERNRRMAHDRRPPTGYVECFRPNVKTIDGNVVVQNRALPLTEEDIQSCEAIYRNQIMRTSGIGPGQ
jgi:arabinofuranosyltransferase